MSKPKCKLIGEDGNVFSLMAIASKTLKEAKMKDKADEMVEKVMASGSYLEALAVISAYVEIV
ncbi:hypothetical protein [Maledivibacter halophilus]|uniref:Uncharacterized protein n=1 Tax=Maledivibacter halophilus TaxID=36842 RepID=A0A1T5K2P6_9FIRM|nr:hypothetical protein [Maledivibacter halophilus]SKC57864.1 hypothetical protein SAMN02194393_01565 [Maledivibacter halophilus]